MTKYESSGGVLSVGPAGYVCGWPGSSPADAFSLDDAVSGAVRPGRAAAELGGIHIGLLNASTLAIGGDLISWDGVFPSASPETKEYVVAFARPSTATSPDEVALPGEPVQGEKVWILRSHIEEVSRQLFAAAAERIASNLTNVTPRKQS